MKFIALMVVVGVINFNKVHNTTWLTPEQKYYKIEQIQEIYGDKQYKFTKHYPTDSGTQNFCQINLDTFTVNVEGTCNDLVNKINGLK